MKIEEQLLEMEDKSSVCDLFLVGRLEPTEEGSLQTNSQLTPDTHECANEMATGTSRKLQDGLDNSSEAGAQGLPNSSLAHFSSLKKKFES